MQSEAKIFDGLGAKKIVVVADRYPPNAIGGAEVSLHYALSGAPSELRELLLVVTFDDKLLEPTRYALDGVDVLSMPNAASWPFNFMSSARHRRLGAASAITRVRARLLPVLGSLWSAKILERLAALGLRYFANPKGGVLTDHLLDQSDCRYQALRRVIAKTDCTMVIADNTRSILLTALLPKNLRKIAVVRDNRFTCARHNQPMIVGKTYCDKCTFSCTREDAQAHVVQRWLHTLSIKRVAQRRRASLRAFDAIIVTSHFLARGIRGVAGENAHIVRIPNVAGRRSQVTDGEVATSNGHDDLLCIGMLNDAKGQYEFVRKARYWIKADSRRRVIFAGRGDRTKAAIQRFAAANGISDQIVFLDYVADRRSLFASIQRAKLIILPPRWKEPAGRVPLEAGLAGKAVVAFGVGGLCETIIHEKTGLLVRPGDYHAFLSACERLLQDDAFRTELGENARKYIEANYSEEMTSQRFVQTIVDFYRTPELHEPVLSPARLSGAGEAQARNARPQADGAA